ncbi:hypothetical protein EV363DRAFT_1455771 [Boletus edulis]|nr:hypothetical protein EV363DRAFT_1455771 [Boletus edulis]
MSQTVSRHVSPSSTLSGCSGSSSSEAASSPIPQLSPATDSACGRIDTTPPINTSIIFPLDSLPNLSLDAARVTSDVYSMCFYTSLLAFQELQFMSSFAEYLSILYTELDDALSLSSRLLGRLGIELGRILEEFGTLEVSLSSLLNVVGEPQDTALASDMTLALHPLVHQIVPFFFKLDSLFHGFSTQTRSTFRHLSFAHVHPTLYSSSFATNVSRTPQLSIRHTIDQIQEHLNSVISVPVPDFIQNADPSDEPLFDVMHHWEVFFSRVLTFQRDFDDFIESMNMSLSVTGRLPERTMSYLLDDCFIMHHDLQTTFNASYPHEDAYEDTLYGSDDHTLVA